MSTENTQGLLKNVPAWVTMIVISFAPMISSYVVLSSEQARMDEKIKSQESILQEMKIKMTDMEDDYEDGFKDIKKALDNQLNSMQQQNESMKKSVTRLEKQALELEFLVQQAGSSKRN